MRIRIAVSACVVLFLAAVGLPAQGFVNSLQASVRANSIDYSEQDVDPNGKETSYKGSEKGLSFGGSLSYMMTSVNPAAAAATAAVATATAAAPAAATAATVPKPAAGKTAAAPAQSAKPTQAFDRSPGFFWGAQANFTNVKMTSDNYTWERLPNTGSKTTDNFYVNTEGNIGLYLPLFPNARLNLSTGIGFRLWDRRFQTDQGNKYAEDAYLFYTPYYVDFRYTLGSFEVGGNGCLRIQFAGRDDINLSDWDRANNNYLNPTLIMKPGLGYQAGATVKYLFNKERNPNDFFHLDAIVLNVFWEQWSAGTSDSVTLWKRVKKSASGPTALKPMATDSDVNSGDWELAAVPSTSWTDRYDADDPRRQLAAGSINFDRWKNLSNQIGAYVGIQISF